MVLVLVLILVLLVVVVGGGLMLPSDKFNKNYRESHVFLDNSLYGHVQ